MSIEYQEIERVRGDTFPFTVTFRDGDGNLIDLTGASFILTVNVQEFPTASQAEEFSVVGSVAVPLSGEVEFTMTDTDADRFGDFYYDIQMTDALGYIRTMMKGPFEMRQDITKEQSHLWTADGGSTVDGSEGIYYRKRAVSDAWEYSSRDGIPILRCTFTKAAYNGFRYLVTNDWPRIDFTRDFRISGLYYIDESWYSQINLASNGFNSYHAIGIENEPGYRDIWVGGHWPYSDQVVSYNSTTSAQQVLVAGWVQWVAEWDATLSKWSGRMWDATVDPVTPQVVTADGEEAVVWPGFNPAAVEFGMSTFGTANAEIAWLKLEYLT